MDGLAERIDHIVIETADEDALFSLLNALYPGSISGAASSQKSQ